MLAARTSIRAAMLSTPVAAHEAAELLWLLRRPRPGVADIAPGVVGALLLRNLVHRRLVVLVALLLLFLLFRRQLALVVAAERDAGHRELRRGGPGQEKEDGARADEVSQHGLTSA